LIGGILDRISERPVRRVMYECSSCLNRAHMRWAWLSLIMVAFFPISTSAFAQWESGTDWRLI